MTVFIWDNTQTIFEDRELSFPIVPASHFKWHRTHKELRGKGKTGDLIISPIFWKAMRDTLLPPLGNFTADFFLNPIQQSFPYAN